MAGEIRTHNTIDTGEKLQHLWEKKWPKMRTTMVTNPTVYEGERKAWAYDAISRLKVLGYSEVKGLTDEELEALTRRPDMILMQTTNERWEQNRRANAEASFQTSVTNDDRVIDGS